MDKTPLCTLTCTKLQLQFLRVTLAAGLPSSMYQVVKSDATPEAKARTLTNIALNFHTTESLLEWTPTDTDKAIRTVTKSGLDGLRGLLSALNLAKVFQPHEVARMSAMRDEVLVVLDKALETATDPSLGMLMPVREMPQA